MGQFLYLVTGYLSVDVLPALAETRNVEPVFIISDICYECRYHSQSPHQLIQRACDGFLDNACDVTCWPMVTLFVGLDPICGFLFCDVLKWFRPLFKKKVFIATERG